MEKGHKIWFSNNKKPFIIREINDKFAICTQPYNFKKYTVIYTIIDFKRNVRGMDNMVFSIYDYYSDNDCHNAMEDLLNSNMEVSSKPSKYIQLDIVKYE